MPKLPFTYQISAGPAAIVLVLSGLISFTLGQWDQVHSQNDVVRHWGRLKDRLHLAIGAGREMRAVANQLRSGKPADEDDLHFIYLEQYQVLSSNLLDPEILEKVDYDQRKQILAITRLNYDEHMDPQRAYDQLNNLLPILTNLHKSWWTQKRAVYIDYYENLQVINHRLVSASLAILVLCILLAAGSSIWTVRSLKRRVNGLAAYSQEICRGRPAEYPLPAKRRDALDELAYCLVRMTEKLIRIVAVEKVLQGAEDERRRIARDMHDQVLSELTTLSRDVEELRHQAGAHSDLHTSIRAIEDNLQSTKHSIRLVLDDLHPQSLDLLGLEGALRSYVDNRLQGPGYPVGYLQVEAEIEAHLTDFQRLSLYRICLEVLNNIVQHAKCGRYEIDLRHNAGEICLIIEDNGTGFDHDAEIKRGGRGLVNIEERAKAIGAETRWTTSRFSSGARFELRLREP